MTCTCNTSPILIPVVVPENDTAKFRAYFVEAVEKILAEGSIHPYRPSFLPCGVRLPVLDTKDTFHRVGFARNRGFSYTLSRERTCK